MRSHPSKSIELSFSSWLGRECPYTPIFLPHAAKVLRWIPPGSGVCAGAALKVRHLRAKTYVFFGVSERRIKSFLLQHHVCAKAAAPRPRSAQELSFRSLVKIILHNCPLWA